MVSHFFFSQLMLIALVWLFGMLHAAWPSDRLQRLCPPARAPSRPADSVAHPTTRHAIRNTISPSPSMRRIESFSLRSAGRPASVAA